VVNLKEIVEIVVRSGIKERIVYQKRTKMLVRTKETTKIFRKIGGTGYCSYCCHPGHIKCNCYKLKNKSNRNNDTSKNDGQGHRIFNSKNVAFTTIAMKNNFANALWILDSGASCHYW
jgi:hypothetical protein